MRNARAIQILPEDERSTGRLERDGFSWHAPRSTRLRVVTSSAIAAGFSGLIAMAACGGGDGSNTSCSGPTCSSSVGSSGAGGDLFGGAGPGVGGSGPGSGSGGACADVKVEIEKVIPTVVLMIDQSGSMTESFGGGSRWDVLRDTLMDPVSGIVKKLENEVRFGLALYSGDGEDECPLLSEVTTSIGNYAAIQAVYGNADPIDETPTGDSMTKVASTLAAYTEPGPKYIILATDGEPDTCAEPNPQNGQEEAIAAAQAAHVQGIGTFIIAVGDDVSAGHQQDMANAGAGLAVGGAQNAPYWTALDPSGLVSAFDTIINGVRSCIFKVNGQIDPDKASLGEVELDGQALGFDDPDGWKLKSPTEIELVGAACQAIQSGEHDLSATFPCGAITPAPK